MELEIRRGRSLIASIAVVAAIASVPLVPALAAGGSGRTYTVRTVAERGSVWIAGGGKTMSPAVSVLEIGCSRRTQFVVAMA